MYNRILVPILHSGEVPSLMTEAAKICSSLRDASITLLHVEMPVHNAAVGTAFVTPTAVGVEEQVQEEGRLVLEQASRWLLEHKIEPTTVFKLGDPAHEICRYAEEEHMDLIIVGQRDKGLLEKLLFGSVSQKVVKNAPSHVLVVKELQDETKSSR